ncbi:metallophosphoesterase [Hyalangium rubrum]|uniref:Metallophosphoesterase n=1 Tax=Hyalangium rubrum TaxID=3103134 RepID=A0ABU5GZ36_9BACT|nr:metallophosphoesterase [Hyalangium sp. s54d21]MDY7226132.1 metallophosphoesterase [Hyalangium sp. s54d21]
MAEFSQGVEHEQSDGVRMSQIPIGLFIRGLLAMLLAVGLIGGLHAYLGVRLVSAPHLGAPWTTLGWGALGLLFVSIPLGFVASRRKPTLLNQVLYWTSMLWLGAFGLLLTATLVADLVGVAWGLFGTAPEPQALARGKALGVVGVVVPALAFAFLTARGRARVERVRVPIAKLGPGLDGVRVVQISDVHIGPTLDRHFLRRVVEQVNALKPDIIAVTGDLVDGSVRTLREEVAPLSGLRAELGVYYVTGNHEYYHGGAAWAAEVARLGLTVLQNEHRVVERAQARLVVAGVTDHEGGRMDPAHACRPDVALASAPSGVPRLLLAHQPRTAFLARGLEVDLQLSGHTHGGQIFPFMFFVKLQQPVIRGLATIAGVRVYTSRGTGYWGPPLRLGPAPEITELTLVAG